MELIQRNIHFSACGLFQIDLRLLFTVNWNCDYDFCKWFKSIICFRWFRSRPLTWPLSFNLPSNHWNEIRNETVDCMENCKLKCIFSHLKYKWQTFQEFSTNSVIFLKYCLIYCFSVKKKSTKCIQWPKVQSEHPRSECVNERV